MAYSSTEPHQEKQRVDQALDVLRAALVEYLSALPRTSRAAYGSADLQTLLKAFIDQFAGLVLPGGVKNLAFAAKDARNEVAHYIGVMAPDDALRHLSNVRQLLKDLGTRSAFDEVDRLYAEQLESLGASGRTAPVAAIPKRSSSADVSRPRRISQGPEVARGKYAGLHRHLSGLVEDEWTTTFVDVEAILERSLPRSARQRRPWWSNTRTHTQAKAWLDAGWRIRGVDTSRETLSFVRSRSGEQGAAFQTDVADLIHFDGERCSVHGLASTQPQRLRRERQKESVRRLRCATPRYVWAYLCTSGGGCLHGAGLPQVVRPHACRCAASARLVRPSQRVVHQTVRSLWAMNRLASSRRGEVRPAKWAPRWPNRCKPLYIGIAIGC